MSISDHMADTRIQDAVYLGWEAAEAMQEARGHLGASEIGHECERKIWLSFRKAANKSFEGRMLRLFNRGKREEEIVYRELEWAGMVVTGTQDNYKAKFGHFAGSADGIVSNVTGAEKTPHILEIKTHSSKSFKEVQKDGVRKAKPQHYAQMQVYMKFSGLTRALYYAVNKDTDEIFTERVNEDKAFQAELFAKAERIVFADMPPERMASNQADYRCKMCDMSDVCWFNSRPNRHCRNCCSATPDRKGGWSCDQGKEMKTCGNHVFIPPMVSDSYEMRPDGCVWHVIDGKRHVDCPENKFPAVDGGEAPEVISPWGRKC